MTELPIGVFDSGIGGLTVLRALARELPGEEFLYLGDTARLPYGTKSRETVERYALQAGGELHRRGVKCLVVACNTASAAALPALEARFAPVPVIGVIEPGAAAAVAATRSGAIAVLATEGTVRSGAYRDALLRRNPDVDVHEITATLLVALAEEGWTDGEVATLTLQRYLSELPRSLPRAVDTLVLGCTHFPPFVPLLTTLIPGVALVDSAHTTALAVRARLAGSERRTAAAPPRFLATDDLQRFARVGQRFLGAPLPADRMERVDLR
ncbi:glutamate racemase [bacterium]|nr:MAG: glutamate racemase [bacterium]